MKKTKEYAILVKSNFKGAGGFMSDDTQEHTGFFSKIASLFKGKEKKDEYRYSETLVDINDSPSDAQIEKDNIFDHVIAQDHEQQKEKESSEEKEEILPEPKALGDDIPKPDTLGDTENRIDALDEFEKSAKIALKVIDEDQNDTAIKPADEQADTAPEEQASDNESNETQLEKEAEENLKAALLVDALDNQDVIIKKSKDKKVITTANTVIDDEPPALEEANDEVISYEEQAIEDKLNPEAPSIDRSQSIIKANSVLSILDKEVTKSLAKEAEKLHSSPAPKIAETQPEAQEEAEDEQEPITYYRSKKGSRIIRPNH